MAQLAGVDWNQVRALWRLKARLTLRQFTREKGRIFGAILLLLLFTPLVIGAAVLTALGYLRLPQPWPGQLLGGVLVLLWLIWLGFPILFASLNESVDVTRLLVYPLGRRELLSGVLLGTLLDYPTYLMLPLLLAVVVGWALTPALPVVLVGVVVIYGLMVMSGLLVSTALGGILQSRRFRDVAIIVSALIGSSCYLVQVSANRLARSLSVTMDPEQFLALRPLLFLRWLPPGAAAYSINQAAAGQWLEAILWLIYAVLWLAVITWAWWRLLMRLVTGEGFLFGLAPRAQQPEERPAARRSGPRLLAWLPDDITQIFTKEWRMAWRTPQRRVGLLQGMLLPFIFGAAFFLGGDGEFAGMRSLNFGLFLPLYAVFIFWATTSNMLGWEGKGLNALFLTPLPRWRMFLGKGLALWGIAGLPLLVIGLLFFVLSPGWEGLGGLLTGLVLGLAAVAVTAVFSVLFPSPVNLSGRRRRSTLSARGGCLTALANLLLLVPAIVLVSLPVVLPLGLAYVFQQPLILAAGLPLALLYAGSVFWFGCRLAGQLLTQREPEVLQATRVEDENGE